MQFLKSLFRLHIIPLGLALLCLAAVLYAFKQFDFSYSENSDKDLIVKDVVTRNSGSYSNCDSQIAEVELIGSLRDTKKLIIFGSSELQGLPYSSPLFLPDSVGIPALAFGHAYHQNFSIACELLAVGSKLEGANVCVLLSPGWFQTKGTNVEAFLEFVRPNFLRSIIHNDAIPLAQKIYIGRYINENIGEINNPSTELIYLNMLYLNYELGGVFNSVILLYKNAIKKVDYQYTVEPFESTIDPKSAIDFESINKRLETEFLKKVTNNKIFVNDDYYSTYLTPYKAPQLGDVPVGREMEDFLLVVEILKKYKCNATFVFQPLNPYHYQGLEKFNDVRTQIHSVLDNNGFPLLDMFVTEKKKYTPGVLVDIMHPDNRGWMDINKFLIQHYNK